MSACSFEAIPRHCKYNDEDYQTYLTNMCEYLRGFHERTRPLVSLREVSEDHRRKFEELWAEGAMTTWVPPTCELTEVYAEATDRLFASEGACRGHRQGKKYVKLAEGLTEEVKAQRVEESKEKDKKLAYKEFVARSFLELFGSWIEQTVQHVRKKQSRSLQELANEGTDSEEEADDITEMKTGGDHVSDSESDEGEENKRVRNPLNLPLGWDGKPIPYWLYKLHGLGQEFKCEICGNQSYWGRKVFERHFQEWRHAFGMRCLKIPNTIHFKEVTKIEDALALYEKVKTETESLVSIHCFSKFVCAHTETWRHSFVAVILAGSRDRSGRRTRQCHDSPDFR